MSKSGILAVFIFCSKSEIVSIVTHLINLFTVLLLVEVFVYSLASFVVDFRVVCIIFSYF